MKARNKKVYGIGINDYDGAIKVDGKEIKGYACWRDILRRCYDEKFILLNPSYKDCSVALEWLFFSNFKRWYDEHHRVNCQIDKDILIKGNRIYSSSTCCFVPHAVNSLFTKCNRKRGKYPIGVSFSKERKKYEAQLSIDGKKHSVKRFKTSLEAFECYKQAKETQIQSIATQYYNCGEISTSVYNALKNYKVEISD